MANCASWRTRHSDVYSSDWNLSPQETARSETKYASRNVITRTNLWFCFQMWEVSLHKLLLDYIGRLLHQGQVSGSGEISTPEIGCSLIDFVTIAFSNFEFLLYGGSTVVTFYYREVSLYGGTMWHRTDRVTSASFWANRRYRHDEDPYINFGDYCLRSAAKKEKKMENWPNHKGGVTWQVAGWSRSLGVTVSYWSVIWY